MNTEQEIDDEVCAIMMDHGPDGHVDGHDLLTALVLRRVSVERERCAKVCESPSHEDLAHKDTGSEWDSLACASAIRRRAA